MAMLGSGSQGEMTGGLPSRNNVIFERILAIKREGNSGIRDQIGKIQSTLSWDWGMSSLEGCGVPLFLFCVIHKCLQIVATPDEGDHKETSI